MAYQPRVITIEQATAAREGYLPGYVTFSKFGYNPDIDNTQEALWPPGGDYVFPVAAQAMEIISTSAQDGVAGTGALTVEIEYLDAAWAAKTVTITMNGVTAVNTNTAAGVSDIFRVNRFYVLTAGTGKAAAGTINLRNIATPTTFYAQIAVGRNGSQQAIFTIPAGKTGYILSWSCSSVAVASGHFTEFRLLVTTTDGDTYNANIFFVKAVIGCQDGNYNRKFEVPIKVPAKSDIKIVGVADAGAASTVCAGAFDGWYE